MTRPNSRPSLPLPPKLAAIFAKQQALRAEAHYLHDLLVQQEKEIAEAERKVERLERKLKQAKVSFFLMSVVTGSGSGVRVD